MTGFVANFLKGGLVGLLCVPLTLWAAESPRAAVDKASLGANKADIHLQTTINGDNHMDIVITSGSGQGCSAGQLWDIVMGGCTPAVYLRTVSTSRSCDCSCPGKGSCSASQSGTYHVYGWRLPTDGREQISSYSDPVWQACSVTSNSCEAEAPPPSNPPIGAPGTTTAIVAADLVCDASNPRFSQGAGSIDQKLEIIQAYKDHYNGFGRCPEYTYAGYQGYFDWQALLTSYSIDSIVAMIKASPVPDSEVQKVVNLACEAGASAVFGPGGYVKSTYIMGSGNGCQVLF